MLKVIVNKLIILKTTMQRKKEKQSKSYTRMKTLLATSVNSPYRSVRTILKFTRKKIFEIVKKRKIKELTNFRA